MSEKRQVNCKANGCHDRYNCQLYDMAAEPQGTIHARVEERNKALEAFEFAISQLPVHYDISVIKQMRENFICKLQ